MCSLMKELTGIGKTSKCRESQLEMKPLQAEQNDQNSYDDVEVDDDLIAEFDSPVLKTKSLAEIYERSELWFGFYWLCTQALRWNCVYKRTFKYRLSQRYENDLPRVDVFICTADPIIEPLMMVINTVLSVMAYDYPPEKLSVYLSDDAGSDLTFYPS
ncbi:hypothetical protein LWI28_009854 [Acer negundo]|uniref:Cellulose synthase n=1 Tax=Acer negundo TaxID=4023 RepID=A0AAD5J556_ACENE|nr:hypothetical protein LWI28_009854 [Acer negundo]